MTPLTLSLLLGASACDASALAPQDAQAILQIESQRLPPLALASFVGSEDAATRQRAAGPRPPAGLCRARAPRAAGGRPRPRGPGRGGLGPGDHAGWDRAPHLPAGGDAADVRIAALRALGGQGAQTASPSWSRPSRRHPGSLRAPMRPERRPRWGGWGRGGRGRLRCSAPRRSQPHRGPTRLAAAYALARIKPASLDGEGRTALLQWTTGLDAAVQTYLSGRPPACRPARSHRPSSTSLIRTMASGSPRRGLRGSRAGLGWRPC